MAMGNAVTKDQAGKHCTGSSELWLYDTFCFLIYSEGIFTVAIGIHRDVVVVWRNSARKMSLKLMKET
jgi:hypothetical protein